MEMANICARRNGAGGSLPAVTEGELPMEAWRIVTPTRSVCLVVRCADRWWVAGRERRRTRTVALRPGFWAIELPTPWRPAAGHVLRLESVRSLQAGHVHRMPGTGRRRLAVESCEALPPNVAARSTAVWFNAAGHR